MSTTETVGKATMDDYVLVGYFRFVVSDKPGVVGEVISQHSSGWAEDSDIPVYRRKGETKGLCDGQ